MNSKKCEVDGDLLLSLDENDLKDDLKMDNGILRKKFTRELNNLKKNADYSCVDQSGVASFLSSIDHKCYSYNLIKAAMDPQYMKKLNASDLDDMLKNDAKISSKFHRHQIIEACHENNSMANHGQYPNVITEEVDSAAEHNQDHYDVYLTYAGSNHGIKEVASLLAIELQLRGFRIFNPSEKQMNLDENSDHDHHYSQESIVKKCKNLVVVLGPGALDGCILDHHSKDPLHRVIKSALHEKISENNSSHCFRFPVSRPGRIARRYERFRDYECSPVGSRLPTRLRGKIGKIHQGRGLPQSFFGGQWGLSDPHLLPPDQLQRQL